MRHAQWLNAAVYSLTVAGAASALFVGEHPTNAPTSRLIPSADAVGTPDTQNVVTLTGGEMAVKAGSATSFGRRAEMLQIEASPHTFQVRLHPNVALRPRKFVGCKININRNNKLRGWHGNWRREMPCCF